MVNSVGCGFESSHDNVIVPAEGSEVVKNGEQITCTEADRSLNTVCTVDAGFDPGDKVSSHITSANAVSDKSNKLCPIYHVNNSGMEEKFPLSASTCDVTTECPCLEGSFKRLLGSEAAAVWFSP